MTLAIEISETLYSAAKLAAEKDGYSVSEQVEYWAKVGKACIENPDMPVNFIIDSIESLKTKDNETEPLIRIWN